MKTLIKLIFLKVSGVLKLNACWFKVYKAASEVINDFLKAVVDHIKWF
jgi:hypothetical protein